MRQHLKGRAPSAEREVEVAPGTVVHVVGHQIIPDQSRLNSLILVVQFSVTDRHVGEAIHSTLCQVEYVEAGDEVPVPLSELVTHDKRDAAVEDEEGKLKHE